MKILTLGSALPMMVALLCSACADRPPMPKTAGELEGFKAFTSGRTGDAPGRIYRIDPAGTVYQVAIMGQTPRTEEHVLYKYTGNSQISFGGLFETIGIKAQALPVSLSTKLEQKRSFETSSTRATREFLEDRDVSVNMLKTAMDGIPVRTGNKYFLIRETLSTEAITFAIDKSNLADAGIAVDFIDLLKASPNVKLSDGSTVSLDVTLPMKYRFWYKAEELNFEKPFGGAAGEVPILVSTRRIDSSLPIQFPLSAVPISP